MEKHYKEMLRFQLMDEIGKINARVATLGSPKDTIERSLIARYGKLLFVSQQLMETFPKLQALNDVGGVEACYEADVNPIIPQQQRGSFSRRFGLT